MAPVAFSILDPLNVRLVELSKNIAVLALETAKISLVRAEIDSLGLHDRFVPTDGHPLLCDLIFSYLVLSSRSP